ncbi:major facilitator superfamily domain-containing protein [Suillus fuscotomentosus]|uniref:Major facilitator superfamily domain-containing protein n=1 Tax=Suillus fuscotomentosus TaxID=1912939 RepID=A0AAD4HN74_9AGAM|nr:major facilitator superfamily domain-containing protein [Suillus fuscotomentosus]KAG1902486.1 major facilitator superfamily domain-containing protein [Suillus fuscotomentosus]
MTGKIALSSVSLIFACGTALFSDGYANNVIGPVNTLLKRIYGTGSDGITTNYSTTLSSVAFAGTVVGMFTFGYLSDKAGRKFGMMSATGIVAVFSGLSSASSGANNSLDGMLAMLIACRFLLGIGIGAEYPCGSVSASEQSEEEGIAKNSQHQWLYTMIDFGFVIGAFVPLVPATGVFLWRLRMEEPNRYKRDSMKHVRIPYRLVIKRYWRGLLGISLAWFIYDFITYVNDRFQCTLTIHLLTVVFGWSVVINLFYIPGTVIGAFFVDLMGPKAIMITGLLAQAVIGFIMSGLYTQLSQHVAAFAVVYGIFLSFGEFGAWKLRNHSPSFELCLPSPGPTAVRGQYYGVAAATGKIGAFIGTWVFPVMINDFGGSGSAKGNTGPFFVASGLAILSAIIVYFLVTPLDHDGMKEEDAKFREYLEAHGFDTSRMGLPKTETVSYAEGKEAGLAVKDTDSATKV